MKDNATMITPAGDAPASCAAQAEGYREGLHEECGVAGVYLPGDDAVPVVLSALHALQHRGQESAGIAWQPPHGAVEPSPGLEVQKGMGLVAQVFSALPAGMTGPVAIGHTRYSTWGSSHLANAQPFVVEGPSGRLALAHNGHLSDLSLLQRVLEEQDLRAPAATDSALLAMAMAHAPGHDWPERIRWTLDRVGGSYGLTMLTDDGLYAARDPLGNRPLSLGRFPQAEHAEAGGRQGGGWMVASESCAFLSTGAALARDVAPGEILHVGPEGPRSVAWLRPAPTEALCAFEYIYLARPDSQFGTRTIYEARREMGRVLAREHPVEADLVAAVPDSGITAALGYAAESGLPFAEALMKNRYVGRTFIHPGVESRGKVLALKFTPLAVTVSGKRVVLVDDSLVRGTTMRALVALLRGAGAREVHLRIAAPPVRRPCFLGVDIPTMGELIAHDADPAEVCRRLGADSLAYVSLEGLAAASGRPGGLDSLCTGCFTGHYPLAVPAGIRGVEAVRGERDEHGVTAGARAAVGEAQ